MRQYLGFLRVSSIVVKVAAWVFLCLGVIGGVSVLAGQIPGNPRWMGIILLVIYAFSFFFLYFIAKMADVLIKIINEIKKEP